MCSGYIQQGFVHPNKTLSSESNILHMTGVL